MLLSPLATSKPAGYEQSCRICANLQVVERLTHVSISSEDDCLQALWHIRHLQSSMLREKANKLCHWSIMSAASHGNIPEELHEHGMNVHAQF